jgi:hypothetical protein
MGSADEQCDIQVKRLMRLMADKGAKEVNLDVYTVVGAYMVVSYTIGGVAEMEAAAMRLESIIDAARRGLLEKR